MGCCSKESKRDQKLNTSINFECPICQSKGIKINTSLIVICMTANLVYINPITY